MESEQLEDQTDTEIFAALTAITGPLQEYLTYVLDNFSYRYFAGAPVADAAVAAADSSSVLVRAKDHRPYFYAEWVESNIKEALGQLSTELKGLVGQLIKGRQGAGRPQVYFRISCWVQEFFPEKGCGSIEVQASVNWDYPHFTEESKFIHCKNSRVEFEDMVALKRHLPRHLEEVCTIFSD